MKRARFRLSRKLVAQVRYYEDLYVISDDRGNRVYTGTDEKTAANILRILNGYAVRADRLEKPRVKRKKPMVRAKSRKRRR